MKCLLVKGICGMLLPCKAQTNGGAIQNCKRHSADTDDKGLTNGSGHSD